MLLLTSRWFSCAVLSLLLSGCLQPSQMDIPDTKPIPILVGLAFSAGPLSPAFDSSTLEYSIAVDYATDSTTVRATASPSSDASLFVNGVGLLSGSTTGAKSLSEGTNTFSIVVTAGNAKKTYTVTITRAKQTTVELSGLKIGTGSYNLFDENLVEPASFKPSDTVYRIAVGVDTVRLGIYPTVAAPQSNQITVNGTPVASGGEHLVEVATPPVTISIVVASATGAKRTYTITVTRRVKTPFASPVTIASGAQAHTSLGSVLELDKGVALTSAMANAQQESIDLVFTYYAGAFHLDNPVAAKAAGTAYGINLTNGYDDARIKNTRIAKVTAKPPDQETARALLQAATPTPSNIIKAGDIFLVLTSEGRIAIVTVTSLTGGVSGEGAFTLNLGGI